MTTRTAAPYSVEIIESGLIAPGKAWALTDLPTAAKVPRGTQALTEVGTVMADYGVWWKRNGLPAMPRNVIFDTDWVTDVDDVGALRVLCWAHKKGYINLIGVVISSLPTSNAGVSPQAISAMLKAEGVSCPVASGPLTAHTNGTSSYNATMAAFAKTIYSATGLLDSVKLYRTLLAAATMPTRLCVCGFLNNIQELLQSSADSISPLSGYELVRQKVSKIQMIGFDFIGGTAEFNVSQTAQAKTATAYVLANSPVPLVINDYNTGNFPSFSSLTVAPTTSDIAAAAYNAFGATANAGRRSWDPLCAFLAAAPSIDYANYTATPGAVSFDSSTGVSSFAAGTGRDYRCTANVTSRAVQIVLDSILTPALQPTEFPRPVNPSYAGKSVPVTGVTDAANLVAWYYPSDVGVADAAAVTAWPDRLGRYPLVQATAGAQPTYAASKVGKPAIAFLTDDALSTLGIGTQQFAMPQTATIYVRTEVDASPGATATILTNNHDTVASANARSVSLVLSTARQVQFSQTSENTYAADVAGTLGTGAWACLTGVLTDTGTEAFIDNVSVGGPTALTKGTNYLLGNLTVGALTSTGTTGALTGWLGEIRIYQGAHTDAQRAAVIAEMAV